MKRILITAALPYANGYAHLGHVAGNFLPADLYARFMRLRGMPVLYVCGSDEYGVAICIAAEQEGVSPRDIVDKYHEANKSALEKLGIGFDIFSRTSNPDHRETAQEFFRDFLEKGYLEEQEEEQFYDPEAQMFLPDRYVEGTCPNCGYEQARSDECENCGSAYKPTDLKNPLSRVSGKTPSLRRTKHWYFRFGAFQQFLEEYIRSHEQEWKDNALQQSWSWLNMGLTSRAITRDLDWGVPVPVENAAGKVIYVWFDALLGYISATREWAGLQGRPDSWKEWWQDADTRYIAFLGKDNIWFHTLMFPAMLHARGAYILPDNVPANEFLNIEGRKFSKSRNWGIDLRDYQADFPSEQDADALRYALALSLPESRDADFKWKEYQARVNNELAAALGNYVNRTLSFVHKYFAGTTPALAERYARLPEEWAALLARLDTQTAQDSEAVIAQAAAEYATLNAEDARLIHALHSGTRQAAEKYEQFRLREAVSETMKMAQACNKYFNDSAPWQSAKNAPEDCAKTLFVCVQALRALATAFAPVTPFSSARMLAMVGAEDAGLWADIPRPRVAAGTPLAKPEILFSRVEDDVIEAQVARLHSRSQAAQQAAEAESAYAPLPPQIQFDDVLKVGLRTGTVVQAEKIRKSKKLLLLHVDLGFERRQIVAGIAQHYSPESLLGKSVVVVANLKPAKLMGVESQGMLLAATRPDGSLALISPDGSVAPGAEVR